MKTLLVLTLTFCTFSIHAESNPNLGDLSGWKFQNTSQDDLLGNAESGATGILLIDKTSDPSPPTVLVYEVPAKYTSKDMATSVDSWRMATFRHKINPAKTTIKDRVYDKNGETRYFAEVSADIGRPNMMPSVVLGKMIDNKVYVFIYENRRNVYQRNIADVMKLFHQL